MIVETVPSTTGRRLITGEEHFYRLITSCGAYGEKKRNRAKKKVNDTLKDLMGEGYDEKSDRYRDEKTGKYTHSP